MSDIEKRYNTASEARQLTNQIQWFNLQQEPGTAMGRKSAAYWSTQQLSIIQEDYAPAAVESGMAASGSFDVILPSFGNQAARLSIARPRQL